MAQTLVRLSTHAVFSTKERRNLIVPEVESDLHAYLSGILKNLASPCIEVNGTANHLHVLFLHLDAAATWGFIRPTLSVALRLCDAFSVGSFMGHQPAASPAKSAGFAAGYTL
jgi:hypothetical protein